MTSLAIHPMFRSLVHAFRMLAVRRDGLRAGSALPEARSLRPGFVSLVGAGPGSADLITLRGLGCLKAADVIYYDRLADPALLAHARPDATLINVGKAPGCHTKSQAEINALLVQAAWQGKRVVRLKCGDPGIFGRGAEEAAALTAAGVEWDIVPGVTSAAAAAASARSFLTERGSTERLILATGHLRHDEPQDWASTARPGTTLACYMGVAQAGAIRQGLLAAGWPEDCAVDIVSKAQTPEERVIHCPLAALEQVCAQHRALSPAMLLIRWPIAAGSDPDHSAPAAISCHTVAATGVA